MLMSLVGCGDGPSPVISSPEDTPDLAAKAQKVKAGMTKDEVVQIVGKPRSELEAKDGAVHWMYSDGPDIYKLKFEEGRVVHYQLMQPHPDDPLNSMRAGKAPSAD
jgi:hypothetical protein